MNEREKRKEELLAELSRRFRDSASAMRSIAARIQAAACQSQEHTRRLAEGQEELRHSMDCEGGPLPFSYLEFLEFANPGEFSKFKEMPVISESDLENLDMDELSRRLQEG